MKLTTCCFVFVVSLIVLSSCKQDEPPEVETLAVSEITHTSALGGGLIINSGSDPVTHYGLCWTDLQQDPTVHNQKTVNQEGETEFTTILENLNSATNYRVRAYASNAIGTSYGQTVLFSTPALSTTAMVRTHEPINITATSALGKGEIVSDNGSPILAYGLCWSDKPGPTVTDNKLEIVGKHSGEFALLIDSLQASSIYYLKAYAINEKGIAYGQQIMFYTNAAEAPEIMTNPISDIGLDSALGGGTITNMGSYQISAYGLVWCLAPATPDTSHNYLETAGTVNQFNLWLTDLSPGNDYNVRAYVKNPLGITYGETVSFTTQFETITDIDGNAYRITQIGDQIWTIDNFKAIHFRDGTPISNQTENAFWDWATNPPPEPAYCWYKNDYQTYGTVYGALYNWHAASHPLLPPEGWRLPTREDMLSLIDYLGGYEVAGGKLKETGFTHWLSPNTGASNSSKFSALGAGVRRRNPGSDHDAGQSTAVKMTGWFWSQTYYVGFGAAVLETNYNHARSSAGGLADISGGLSVRFIKE